MGLVKLCSTTWILNRYNIIHTKNKFFFSWVGFFPFILPVSIDFRLLDKIHRMGKLKQIHGKL